MLKHYSIALLLLLTLVSCKKIEEVNKDWIQTQNNYFFFGNVNNDTLTYIWEGNAIENVIHGNGVLSSYYNEKIFERKKMSAYWGTFNQEDIILLSNNEQYIGKTRDSKFLNGFGVLIKANREVYIGYFNESEPNGFLTLYKGDKVYYKGEWKNGVFNGFGTLYKADGDVKAGIWKNGKLTQTNGTVKNHQGTYSGGILNNLPEGYGVMKYNNGSYYNGFWQKSKWNRTGYFISACKDSIAGEWQNGKLEGYGVFKSSFFIYEGDWSDNEPNGNGYISYVDSTFYTGNWSEGKKTGYGDIVYSNTDSYFGEWLEDEPNGIGRYYYNNGDRYNGEWKRGFQHGVGIYTAKDFRYEGNWQQGWIHGEGIISYPNGDYYEGNFVENEKQGIGYYHFSNGNFYEGEFTNGRFNGLGIFQFADKNRYEGNFIDGRIAGDGTLYYREGTETIAITAFWDGTSSFPKEASVLFSNGDLYEGELINGFPTEKGIWTTEEERLKGKDLIHQVSKANEFYKKHRDTWNKAVIGISVVLTATEMTMVSTGVGIPIAGVIHIANVGLNILDASVAIASATIDVMDAKRNGEEPTEAYMTLATEVSVNTSLLLIPKALQKPAATSLRNTVRNVASNAITRSIARKSAITFTSNKSFAKVIKVTKDTQKGVIKTLDDSTGKLLEKVGYKRFTKISINNGELLPSRRFRTGEFGYWGYTDKLGRLSKVKTDNLQLTKREGRLPHNYNTPGKLEGDHAGHMIGDRFGGSPELDNLVSQAGRLNLSEFKKLENHWAKSKELGKKVKLEIDIIYKGNNTRPSSFNVKYKIDGKPYEKILIN